MATKTPLAPDRAAQLADLAHFVLSVARDLRLNGHEDPGVVEISELESLVMDHVQRHPGVSPSRICATVGIRSSNTSAVLRSLEAKGMIRRDPDPGDRRAVRVHPTEAAARNLATVRREWSRFLAPHVDDSAALETAVELLRGISGSISQEGAGLVALPTR